MSLIDVSKAEHKRMLEWAIDNSGTEEVLDLRFHTNTDSYFTVFDSSDDVVEYGFDTILKLREYLEKMWGDSECMKAMILPCAVGIFKAKPQNIRKSKGISSTKSQLQDNDIEINDFVYVF